MGAVVETGDNREKYEGHVRRDFGSSKGAAAMGIQQVWQGRWRGGRGGYGQRRARERHGGIGMMGRRQVTSGWADGTVRIQDGRRWRGCWGRRGTPPSGRTLYGRRRGRGGSIIAM